MTKMEEIPKEHLSLAGEYAVASELCKMGIYAQLTLGIRKKTDILVDTGTAMLRIQVKTKQVRNWTFCKGISGDNIVLVFVDYKNKTLEDRPDFYILTSKDWEVLVKTLLSAGLSSGEVKLDEENCPIYIKRIEKKKGNKGMDVLPKQIAQHKERWDKIGSLLPEKR